MKKIFRAAVIAALSIIFISSATVCEAGRSRHKSDGTDKKTTHVRGHVRKDGVQ